MAHTEQVKINGIMTTARVFDQPAQAIDDAVSRALPGGAIDTDLAMRAPLASPALTGTPTINGVPAANVGQLCNPNLLDNWYFANPVDQRGGYVVPPGVNYHTWGGQSVEGVTDKYISPWGYGEDGNPLIAINGVNYWTKKEDGLVRGYTGAGYGIDRWTLLAAGMSVTINDDGTITVYGGPNGGSFGQFVENMPSAGTKVSGSVEIVEKNGRCFIALQQYGYDWIASFNDEINNIGLAYASAAVVEHGNLFSIYIGKNSSAKIKAVKLELGNTQTLAHQDENGNWVLNEIPDYGEQLARCQGHQFQVCSGNNGFVGLGTATSATDCKILLPIPVTLRTTPTITYSGSFVLIAGAGNLTVPVTAMAVQFCSNNAVSISCTTAGGLTTGQTYKLYYLGNPAKLLLDANL